MIFFNIVIKQKMLIQMCKISKVFSINFILIRCGSVPYNYKAENVFAVCHMIRHTAKDFAVCHSTGHTAKLAEAVAGDTRRRVHASPSRWPCAPPTLAGPAAAPRPLLCRVPDRGAHGKGGSFAVGQIVAPSKAPVPYPL